MDSFAARRYIIGAIFVLFCILYIGRLFYIQVIDEQYKLSALNNSRRLVTIYPARGLIYDRNGKLLVYNEAAYDLKVIPGQIKPFDTTAFIDIIDISKEDFYKNLDLAKRYSYYRPSVFLKQISAETYSMLQEVLHRFPGFFAEQRTLRKYPYSSAANVLGYVGEVNTNILENNKYYEQGDYIGISGLEASYEKVLRGEKGGEYFLVDVRGRIKGRLSDGKYDKKAVVGTNIYTTLDIDLQNYGEKLMQNKIGSIVAIEPRTGEVLALVSSPTYDPNQLVGRGRSLKYTSLVLDSLNPLFNRALMAKYPPGSTFKPFNALIALQEGIISSSKTHTCNNGYYAGRIKVRCHQHPNPVNLKQSIMMSCNAYYCHIFRDLLDYPKFGSHKIGFNKWHDHLASFGFGEKLGTDFTSELNGNIPTVEYFDNIYGERGWRSLTVISLSIGQGELGMTPIQMANATAAIANKGYYKIPHIIRRIDGDEFIDAKYKANQYTTIDKEHFEPVIEGMSMVVQGGEGATARWVKIPDIEICGKTGTVQNPHGENHSVFIGFAPKDDPQIAIAVYVENAGYGSVWAAPIASLMIEKYLTGSTKRTWFENRILEANLLDAKKN
jgi:penicillin-binding protein 2